MLQSLSIRDVVLIQSLDLDFHSGLVVLTGETGAGKSILLDSLGLAMGNRADTGLIRSGAEKSTVTATFQLPKDHPVFTLLEEQDLSWDDNQIIIRRILTSEGRNKCFINDQSVTQSFLKQVAQHLIEIHGQFDHLLDGKTHMKALDLFGQVKTDDTTHAYKSWHEARQALTAAQERLASSQDREAFLRFSKSELEDLAPKPGEEEELLQARSKVAHRAKISDAAQKAEQALNGNSTISHVVEAQRNLQRAEEYLPDAMTPLVQTLDRALVELEEASQGIQSLIHDVAGDSHSLESLDDRLHALRSMAKKHHVPVDELADLLERFTEELSQIDQGDLYIEELEKTVKKTQQVFEEAAQKLTAQRQKVAKTLEAAIANELTPLKLGQATFTVHNDQLPESQWSRHGWDRLEFHISTNPGSPSGPLAKIASGGELSRLMLALKVVLSQTTDTPSLIFDEIDSGTGGAVAAAIGARLDALSQDMQVLVITHSPQVAALGDQHLHVLKEVANDQTTTHVLELAQNDRIEELARMLSGSEITAEARAQAKQLMAVA